MTSHDARHSVLFVCHDNSARSVMAESLLAALGKDRFEVFSGAIVPAAMVSPFCAMALKQARVPARVQSPRHWREVIGDRPMDLIFVLDDCGAKAPELGISGRMATAVWPIPDPLEVAGSDAEKAAAFGMALGMLRRPIEILVELRLDGMDRRSPQSQIDRLHGRPRPPEQGLGADDTAAERSRG
jgi:protein-tyrosine-phosphatase